MSEWREVEELLANGRMKLQSAQLQMQQVNGDPLADVNLLLELDQTKPNVDWVFKLQKHITEDNLEGPRVQKLENELSEMAESVVNYTDFLRTYRTQKESFQQLIQGCTNKEINFETYSNSLIEWRKIKELFIESPLHNHELVRQYVTIDCLFQIMYFMAEPHEREYGKVKLAISSLMSKWDIEDLIMENPGSASLLSSFLCNQKDRFCLLGKRESSARANCPSPIQDVQGTNRRKRAFPPKPCNPSTEKSFKERKDCFSYSKSNTGSKHLDDPNESLEPIRNCNNEGNRDTKIEPSDEMRLGHLSKTLTNLTYEELCESVKDKNLAQQHKVDPSLRSNYKRLLLKTMRG
jgi:hypothetical protein